MAEMPADLLALLEAARRDPHDDLTRLALADWLEENGPDGLGSELARQIRLQFTRHHPWFHYDGYTDGEVNELEALHQEEWLRWSFPRKEEALSDARGLLHWCRGLVWAKVSCPEDLLALEPLGPSPWLEGLDNDIYQDYETMNCQPLATSPSLAHFTYLHLIGGRMKDAGAVLLSTSPYLMNLITIDLTHNFIGAAGAAALAASPQLGNLNSLTLHDNEIGTEGMAALASSVYITNLTRLEVGFNNIDDAGVEALASSSHLGRLTTLSLNGNKISHEGLTLLKKARPGLTIYF